MIKFEHTDTHGIEAALRGMRNPMNSWARSDSVGKEPGYIIGPNDAELLEKLIKGGPEHRKALRMIGVWVDITAPLYWWKQFDTYQVGVVKNSCSTMHKLTSRELTLEDFSLDVFSDPERQYHFESEFLSTLVWLNDYIEEYKLTEDREIERALFAMLPDSFNQKRTVFLNYEVILRACTQRRGHNFLYRLQLLLPRGLHPAPGA